jgi:integrase
MAKGIKRSLPQYCSWNYDRHGGKRVRFRHSGLDTYIPGIPWTEDFMRAYGAAMHGAKDIRDNIGASRTMPGSMNAVIVRYYRSAGFAGLRDSTKAVRRGIIERFRVKYGDCLVKTLKPRHVKDIMAKMSATPEAANNLLKVLRQLLNEAIDMELIVANPALSVQKYKSRGDGIHTWTDEEIAQFEARHPIGTKARLAMALLLYTGQRKGDVVNLGWQHISGDLMAVRQQKTDTPLKIPVHPDLKIVLANLSREHLTFIVTEQGAPFTAAGFGGWFRDRCDEAGLPQCSAHGLRKAIATRLSDAGCSEDEIKAITGHKSSSSLSPYTKARNQERLARQAQARQIGAENDRALSNLSTQLDKKETK